MSLPHLLHLDRFMFFLLIFLSLSSSIFASTERNAYLVKNVPIERTADSAKEARDNALMDSQIDAFWQLAQRMVHDEKLGNFPKQLTSKEVSPLIHSFSVSSERTTPQTYSAVLNYEFEPYAVKSFFDQHHMPYNENFIPDMLVMPLMLKGAIASLWEEDNSWMQAWKSHEDRHIGLPYKLPLSDINDLSILQAKDVLEKNTDKLNMLATRYNLQDILICTLYMPPQIQRDSTPEITIEITHYPITGSPALQFPPLHHTGPITEETLNNLKQAALNTIWAVWKKQGPLITNEIQSLQCATQTPDLKTLLEIRKRLNQIHMIKDANYTDITQGNSQLCIRFCSNLELLKAEVSKFGLELAHESAGWQLRLR